MSDHVRWLGPASTGRWLVTTAGARYIWDLDEQTIERHPTDGRSSPIDGVTVVLAQVDVWPTVGKSTEAWFRDQVDLSRRRLRTSPVTLIEEASDE